jgi:hypothetical protein
MVLWLRIVAFVGTLLYGAHAQLVVVDRDSERAIFMAHSWTDPSLVPDLAVTCLQNGIEAVNCDKIYRELRAQHIGVSGDGAMAPPHPAPPPLPDVREDVKVGGGDGGTGASESLLLGAEEIVRMCTLPEPSSPDSTVVSIIIPSLNKPTLERALASLDAQSGIDEGDFEVILVLDGVSIKRGTGGALGTSGVDRADGTDGNVDTAQAAERQVASWFRDRPWLCVVQLPTRVGRGNSGGEVRNVGLDYARGALVGFLDDDDSLAPDYVSACRSELAIMNEWQNVVEDDVLDEGGGMHGMNSSAAPAPAPAVDAADTAGTGRSTGAGTGAGAGAVVFRMLSDMPFAPLLPPPYTRALKAEHVGISFAVRRSLLLQHPAILRFHASPREDFDFISAVTMVSAVVLSPRVTYFVRSAPRALTDAMSMVVASLSRVRIARGGADIERVLTGLGGLEGNGGERGGLGGGESTDSRRASAPTSVRPTVGTSRVVLTVPVYVVTVNADGSATGEEGVQTLQVLDGDSVEVAVGAFCQTHSLVEVACQALLAAARTAVTAEGAKLLVGLADGRIYFNPDPVRSGGSSGGSSGVAQSPPLGTVTADQILNNDVPVLYIGADQEIV